MANQAASLLGVDINLINGSDAKAKIVKSCAACWFDKNANHLYNMSDCSGFVKAVQQDIHLRPFVGEANSIYREVEDRADWIVLGAGSGALVTAGQAAEAGLFTIGVWQNPSPGEKGHVAIITSYLPMLGAKPEQHAIGAWGQYGSVGSLLGKMSNSFGSTKHAHIRYAKCLTPVF
jgi:hypothetical protein